MKSRLIATALMLSTMVVFPINSQADSQATALEYLLTEMAEKPEHHTALANYFKEKADETRLELERHKRMRAAYSHGYQKKGGGHQHMQAHCDRLIGLYESAIKEYEGMVDFHTQEAKKP